MASVQQSPSLTAKLKTRDAANRIKHGSPKLQEVLRQRCRQRMREKRGQLFNRRRQGFMETDEEVHEALTEMVREEFSQLDTVDGEGKIILGDEIYEPMSEEEAAALEKEFLMEEEQWILQEYERFEALFAEESEKDQVICPLCEKAAIAEIPDFLACPSCSFRLPVKVSVDELGRMIQDNISAHSSSCSGQPSFMLVPEDNTVSLCLTCDICSSFSAII